MTTDWLQRWGLLVSLETAGQALEAVSRDASFHPVRDYLESLTWDGVPRLEGWLAQYLGVDDNTFSRAVASKWMVSAIARVYRPGIKADCCLILEGAQGIKKSTALRVLAGDWYTDEIADLGSKDSAMQARGVWIIELAELDSLSRSDVGRVKAFISRGTDRFRPPYAKRLILSPRQCVFAGTVNQTAYLRDETGGRRFWPVSCGLINIEALMRDRDQLWAEARWRFEAGELWWMHTQELNDAAEQEQTARYQGDPWDTLVKEYVENRWLRHAPVTVPDILGNCLNIPKERWRQADSNRVARCLRADGWVRRQVRDADSEGRPMREWRYCKGKDVCRDDQSDPNWRYR